MEEKRELIKAYQRLTGVVITLADEDDEDDEDDARTVQCTAINHIHKRVTKFDLLLPAAATEPGGKTGHATFVPTANKQLLPLNLREAARLDPNQLPVLFQVTKLCTAPSLLAHTASNRSTYSIEARSIFEMLVFASAAAPQATLHHRGLSWLTSRFHRQIRRM